jgi:hypothetical protein
MVDTENNILINGGGDWYRVHKKNFSYTEWVSASTILHIDQSPPHPVRNLSDDLLRILFLAAVKMQKNAQSSIYIGKGFFVRNSVIIEVVVYT